MFDYLSAAYLDQFITAALLEDIGPGDYSTLGSIPAQAHKRARLLCKSDGIIAGVELAGKIFSSFDPALEVQYLKKDGDAYAHGDIGFIVSGSARSILSCERVVLNCIQRMSGIATYTHRVASLIAHTKAKVLDTRKTTPNFRICEKWAVKIGGGVNHRYALYDMVMLKDNHIEFAGSISKAVHTTVSFLKENGLDLEIEVEVRNMNEFLLAISEPAVSRILLDNMSPADTQACVQANRGKILEASGGITEQNIVAYAEAGVDFISLGALTHSAKALDFSLKAF